jgi:plastocyanin
MAITSIPQVEFSCNMPKAGSPDNPTLVAANRSYVRKFFSDKLPLPDGDVEIWSFEDPGLPRTWPAALIRATEGEVVHVEIQPSKKVHTIHHHGIEPEPINDGVGHTSFEISGHYTYQWKATTAGTYFYHCHVNTTLHVQMGMFGALVIDPKPDPSLKPGQKQAFANGPVYEKEVVWAFNAIDPTWHGLNHAAGLCDTQDVGLNNFRPRYVMINDCVQPFDANGFVAPGPFNAAPVAITARSGQPILIRNLNSTYIPVVVVFHPDAQNPANELVPVLIASDGRPFHDSAGQPAPITVPQQRSHRNAAGQELNAHAGTRAFMVSSAERYDAILNTAANPAPPGVYVVEVEFREWFHPHRPLPSTVAPVYKARTTITIV